MLWPFHEGCDVVHENLQPQERILRGAHTKEQATPFRTKENDRDGLERLRHAPFKLNAPRMLEVAAQHMQTRLGGKLQPEAHTTGRPTRSNDLAKSSTKVIAPWSFSAARESSLSISSSVTHSRLCSSIQPVSSIPPNTLPFLASRHLKRPQPLPSTNQGKQKSNGLVARDVFRKKKYTIV